MLKFVLAVLSIAFVGVGSVSGQLRQIQTFHDWEMWESVDEMTDERHLFIESCSMARSGASDRPHNAVYVTVAPVPSGLKMQELLRTLPGLESGIRDQHRIAFILPARLRGRFSQNDSIRVRVDQSSTEYIKILYGEGFVIVVNPDRLIYKMSKGKVLKVDLKGEIKRFSLVGFSSAQHVLWSLVLDQNGWKGGE